MKGGKPLLEIRNVKKSFGGIRAVDGVSFEVNPGRIKAIIGPNGAGKTTLFNLITGEFKPTGGKIFLDDEDITGLPPHLICQRGLSRTFQLTSIFPELTVYESIWVGINSKRHRWNPFTKVKNLTDVAERAEKICHLIGLQEKKDELAVNLSYGDQKILEIGMALSTEPSILLLDEPTQGVSPKEAEEIIGVIQRLAKDITVILIEHSVDVVLQVCHKVTVLHEGRVIAEGDPAEISKNEEVQRVYLGEE